MCLTSHEQKCLIRLCSYRFLSFFHWLDDERSIPLNVAAANALVRDMLIVLK